MIAQRRFKLREVDVRVLEGLGLRDPRNKTKLAADLGMTRESLSYRIRRLQSHFSLFLQGNVYHTNIGLRKVFLDCEAKPGYENILYDCLKANDYWLYATQCLTVPRSLATYGIPAGKESQFQSFVDQLSSLDFTRNIVVSWSTCIHTVNATGTWFDPDSETWSFPWQSWIREVETIKEGELPYTLKEPEAYEQLADYTDIFILKELEKNCTVKLKDIARKLGISLQLLRYHYLQHVLKKQMFEGQQILADHYRGLDPQTAFVRYSFSDYPKLDRFALSLITKPFVRAIGKVYRENRLFTRVYLPNAQVREFLRALSTLVQEGLVDTYDCCIEDMSTTQRQTISYEYFKDKTWEYDPRKYEENVKMLLERSRRIVECRPSNSEISS